MTTCLFLNEPIHIRQTVRGYKLFYTQISDLFIRTVKIVMCLFQLNHAKRLQLIIIVIFEMITAYINNSELTIQWCSRHKLKLLLTQKDLVSSKLGSKRPTSSRSKYLTEDGFN